MRSWTPRTILVATLGVALMLGAGALIRDASRDRTITIATPSPPGVFSHPTVAIGPGRTLCVAPVTFVAEADVASIVIAPAPRASRLEVTVRAGDARQTTRIPSPALSGPQAAFVPISHLKRPATGSLCVENVGRFSAGLLGTDEVRFQTLSRTTVDDRPATASATLTLLDSRKHSLLARFDDAVARASLFSGGVPKALLWLLVALVAFGIPVAVVVSTLESFRRTGDDR